PEPVARRALPTDHDPRPGGVDVDPDPVPSPLDVHLGDTGPLQPIGDQTPDLHILGDIVGVQLVRVPARGPVTRDAEPEPVRVYLLSHYSAPSSASVCFFAVLAVVGAGAALAACLPPRLPDLPAAFAPPWAVCFRGRRRAGVSGRTASTRMLMWPVRFRIGPGRICARGRHRRSVGPSSTYASVMSKESGSSCSLFSALAMALATTL